MATDIHNLNDFDIICRVCLKKRSHLTSIFKNISTARLKEDWNAFYNLQSYRDVIEDCASIQIMDNDSLPKNLCKFCVNQLEQSYKLKIQCLSSERILQNLAEHFKTSISESNLTSEENDSNFNEIKNEVCENTVEIIIKEEVFEDSEINDRKLDISSGVTKLDKEDDNSIEDKSSENAFICTTKEEPEEFEEPLDDLNFKCQECSDLFLCKVDLLNHKKTHLKPRYKCEFCDKVFLAYSAYRNHYHKAKQRCKVCSKECECETSLSNHLKDHTKCEKCGKDYQPSDICKGHVCEKTIEQEKPCYLCPRCGKTLSDKWSFKQHMMIHNDDKTYHCRICESKFNTHHTLRLHLTTHSNERPYECDVCKKKYKYSSALRRHKISHTDYRIPCNFCDKLWKSKDTLRKHQLVHTGERKFICTYCNKPFGRNDNLQVHLRIHTGEKPFVCDKCGTGFSAKHVLRGHMKTHQR